MLKSTRELLKSLNVNPENGSICTGTQWVTSSNTETINVHSPVDGSELGKVIYASESDYETVILKAQKAAEYWKTVPAPERGSIVRQYGIKLRAHKKELGKLVSLEMGKSYQEGLGEVQEMIDICDFAVGLSRQLYGLTMHSERPNHRMYEQWHPIGIVGIISAFNFPVAVWAWNSMIATVCGDVCVWKPSEKTPLTAIACHRLLESVITENKLPEGIFNLVIGNYKIGESLAKDKRIPMVSATGSTRMGKKVSEVVGARLGSSLLELGGNNAVIISEHANLDNALIAAVFGCVGTAGQRCTSTRRLLIHESIFETFKTKLVNAYGQLSIGNPLDENNHVGPLIDEDAVNAFINAVESVKNEGGEVLTGGQVLSGEGYESGCYVKPCIATAKNHFNIVQEETFGPIVYLIPYQTLDEAIQLQNDVKQGLSSAIFTDNIQEAERFLSAAGSDCGIANVNIGTSGAEIGGAFGGEKETGGGRESGSDAWKKYMRRQTNTINYGTDLPLAQGIKFDL
ncbi:aldehyde dehydrogenase family protein [Bacteroidia bacterium]|jgi:aldehyde dehydrogenase (NAD+)|nr:aldehyde dehydrogenase family protein [Bacteroidia bacterium]MDC0560584.1 aldehyde dehydrogenase family protein [Bacteroidia bacterium]MDC3406450.1 aldehyde dehydrogenase family protein [Bacteroidia bacterium]